MLETRNNCFGLFINKYKKIISFYLNCYIIVEFEDKSQFTIYNSIELHEFQEKKKKYFNSIMFVENLLNV